MKNKLFLILAFFAAFAFIGCGDDDSASVGNATLPAEAVGSYEGTFTPSGTPIPEEATATISSSSPYSITFSNGSPSISGITLTGDNASGFSYNSGGTEVAIASDNSGWVLTIDYASGSYSGEK